MSFDSLKWAWDQNVESPGRKIVLIGLAQFADSDGFCFPSQRTLAERTSQTERTVRSHLEWLENNDFISRVHRRRDNGSQTSDLIQLHLDKVGVFAKKYQRAELNGNETTIPENFSGCATGKKQQPPEKFSGGTTGKNFPPPRKNFPALNKSFNNSLKKKKEITRASFDFETGKFSNLGGIHDLWKNAYPAVNVDAELKKAAMWLISNPKNRKSDYVRFLTGWLSRAQDRAPRESVAQSKGLNYGNKLQQQADTIAALTGRDNVKRPYDLDSFAERLD